MNSKISTKAPDRYCKIIRKTVKELPDGHNLKFKEWLTELSLRHDESIGFQTVVIVADEIFNDGQVNWGRIVTVYAFAAHLSKHYIDHNPQSDSKPLVKYE